MRPDGSFSIEYLEPGDYVIALNVKRPPKPEIPYLPTYFPGVANIAQAQVFHDVAAQDLNNDFDYNDDLGPDFDIPS